MNCDHDGGTMLPHNGTWVGTVEGDESERYVYCFVCGDVYAVTRENVNTERVGNINAGRSHQGGEPDF